MLVLIEFNRLSSCENLRLDFTEIIFAMGRGAKLPVFYEPNCNSISCAEPYGRYCNTSLPASLGFHFIDSFQEQAPDGLSEMKNPF